MNLPTVMSTLHCHEPTSCKTKARKSWRNICLLLAVLLSYCLIHPTLLSAHGALLTAEQPLVTQEIRYQMPEAGEVFLIWGVNGWSPVPEKIRPSGTEIKDGRMYTSMSRDGVTFVATLQVPSGATIDYMFLITKTRTLANVQLWDQNGAPEGSFHTTATPGGVVVVMPTIEAPNNLSDAQVTQEIRYVMPEASEVILVWGINGWAMLPKANQPAGTWIKKAVMYTPMIAKGDAFVAQLRVPVNATVNYGFLITKNRSGAGVEVWEAANDKDAPLVASQDGIVEIHTKVTLEKAKESTSVLDVGLNALIGASIVLVMGVVLARIPRRHSRRSVLLALSSLTLLGFALRIWFAWHTNQILPNTAARLAGDETGYDYLGYALLQGEFFTWPGRTPVYPLFLAACYLLFGHSYAKVLYIQGLVSTIAIPLSYILARRYVSNRGALVTAALIALHPALITQVARLYTEAIYTPLLLLVLLSLLWALEQPAIGRFMIAGALLAVATLCRPATLLMPAMIPVLLPKNWSIRNKITTCLAYTGMMIAVIAPWTYHNYRTYHTVLPLSVSLGALWQGSPEFYHLMEQRLSLTQIWDEQLNPDINGGHDVFTIEGDRYFTSRAIASIRAEPKVYAWYCLQKLAFFWIGHPASEWPDYEIFKLGPLLRRFPAWQIVGIFVTRLLPLLALTGLVMLRRRIRQFIPLLIFCGYFMFFYAMTYATGRYSEPLHPIVITLIVAAGSEIWAHYQARGKSSTFAHVPMADASTINGT